MTLPDILRKLWPSRIRSQLILGIASVTVLLMSLFAFEMINRQKSFFLKLNRERANALSSNLANAATSYVISYEVTGLQKLVSSFKDNPGLEYAIVLTDDGTVIAHTDPKYLGLKAVDSISTRLKPVNRSQTLVENNSILDIAAPVTNNNEIVGWARIGLSQKYVEPSLQDIRNRGLFYIFLSVIIGSLFAIFVAGRLSKGLQKLVTAAEKIKAGDRGIRVEKSSSHEISHLGTAFNQMLDDISSNEKLLSMVLENMPVGVWILDKEGNILSANPAGIDLWKGVQYVGIDNYNVYKAWFTSTGKEVKQHEWGGAIAVSEGKPVINQEIEIECFDKSHKIVLNSAIPLRDSNEQIMGAITINVDITARKHAENTLRKINHDIGERVKELDCLYHTSEISNDPHKSMEDILQECADIIPASYQYPGIACARIEFNGQLFTSGGFLESPWKQEAIISSKRSRFGKVQVFYKQEMKAEAEGPFLREERLLINSIADILASAAERRKAEAIIKEQAETFEAIIENANDSIFLLSPDLKVLQYNKTAKDRLQLNSGKEIYLGADFKEFLYQDTQNIFLQMFKVAVTGKYIEQETYQANLRDELFWIRSKMYPIYDMHKNLLGVTVLAENITDRKRAENELKESEEKFRSLVEETLVGVFIIQNEVFIYANPGFEKICGYSNEELMAGMSFQQLIYKDDLELVEDNYELRITGKKPSDEYQLRAVKKDGAIIYVDLIVSAIIFNSKPAVIGSVIDKTHQVEEEKRIGRAVTDAQEKERTQIGMELHDNVKQMMAASLMSLDFVKKNFDKKEESIGIINDVRGYILEAINELRRLSHQLTPSADDDNGTLVELIEKLINDFKISDKMEVFVDIDEFEQPVNADVQLAFYRIIQEQFSNILKYSKASGVFIKIRKGEKDIYLSVRDDGIGFNSSQKKNGIGLENIRRRARVLNGEVRIISAPREGCEVTVSIPLPGSAM